MESNLTIGTDRTAGESRECCEASSDLSQGKLRFVLGQEAETSIYSTTLQACGCVRRTPFRSRYLRLAPPLLPLHRLEVSSIGRRE